MTAAPASFKISIHALREERDVAALSSLSLSTSISIHALREERDRVFHLIRHCLMHFNPRAPRGARLYPFAYSYPFFGFQSTRSARSATKIVIVPMPRTQISIHALREERD